MTPFLSKCGVKSIDLDKNESIFVQMWAKKYRFGQKISYFVCVSEKILLSLQY